MAGEEETATSRPRTETTISPQVIAAAAAVFDLSLFLTLLPLSPSTSKQRKP